MDQLWRNASFCRMTNVMRPLLGELGIKEAHNLNRSMHHRLLNLAHHGQYSYDLVLVRYAL